MCSVAAAERKHTTRVARDGREASVHGLCPALSGPVRPPLFRFLVLYRLSFRAPRGGQFRNPDIGDVDTIIERRTHTAMLCAKPAPKNLGTEFLNFDDSFSSCFGSPLRLEKNISSSESNVAAKRGAWALAGQGAGPFRGFRTENLRETCKGSRAFSAFLHGPSQRPSLRLNRAACRIRHSFLSSKNLRCCCPAKTYVQE